VVLELYGSKYQFNIWLCLLFTIASVLSLFNAIYGWCINATGERGIKLTSVATIMSAVINMIVNILLIPLIGFWGAVIALISAYIVFIIIISRNREYYKLDRAIK